MSILCQVFFVRYHRILIRYRLGEYCTLLEILRKIEPGKWKKVYQDGFDTSGNLVSIHYFQSLSGKVFDVKVKFGWSN